MAQQFRYSSNWGVAEGGIMRRGEEQAGLQRSGTKSRDRNTRAAFPTETLNPDPEAAE